MRLLLHVCCGPCSTHPVEVLRADHDVTLFFSNSNISPETEYQKRLEHARISAEASNLSLVADTYAHEDWLNSVRGLEGEPEGGVRCDRCFQHNLGRTARHAAENGFDAFTTTLTVSPHKNSMRIFEVAKDLNLFLPMDFKKKGGFQRSREISAALGLYRQSYCGCEFTLH